MSKPSKPRVTDLWAEDGCIYGYLDDALVRVWTPPGDDDGTAERVMALLDGSAPAEVARVTWRKEPPTPEEVRERQRVEGTFPYYWNLQAGSTRALTLGVGDDGRVCVVSHDGDGETFDLPWGGEWALCLPPDKVARVTPAVEATGTFTAPGRVVSGGIDPVTQCRRVVVEIEKGALVPSMEPGERVTVRKG